MANALSCQSEEERLLINAFSAENFMETEAVKKEQRVDASLLEIICCLESNEDTRVGYSLCHGLLFYNNILVALILCLDSMIVV